MRRLLSVAALAAALAACSPEEQADPLAPTDRLYFPIGIGTGQVGTGPVRVVVASSNFDLRYSAPDGGTLLSVAEDAATGVPAAITPVGSQRIASYAGPVAVVDKRSCPTLADGEEVVLVASRYADVLYRFNLASSGALGCTDGKSCELSLDAPADDPFAITVACGPNGRRAFVGYLDTPDATVGYGYGAWIAEVDLDTAAVVRTIEVGDGSVRSLAYDAGEDRLWLAARSTGSRALLYTVDLSDPAWKGSTPWVAMDAVDLDGDPNDAWPDLHVAGAELHSLALGAPPGVTGRPQRIYATVRLYDPEAQASSGSRPSGSIGGNLIALDVTYDTVYGRPIVRLAWPGEGVPIGTGLGDVAVVRSGGRDYVLATTIDADRLLAFDEDGGELWELAHDAVGLPLVGDQPVALTVDPAGPWVYVASFGNHLVRRFKFDPMVEPTPFDPAVTPTPDTALMTLGGLAP
jgi:hypothetical protein